MFESVSGFIPEEYLLALGLFAGIFLVVRLVLAVLHKMVPEAPGRDAGSPKNLSRALSVLAAFAGILAAARVIGDAGTLVFAVNRISYTAITVSAAYIAYALFLRYLARTAGRAGAKKELVESLGPILGSIVKIILAVFAAVYILGVWGVEIAPMLAGLGIAGLALALALQPLLGNLFNGLSLILDETFRVGDVIKLSSGEMGSVYRVGLRTTKIKTFDNEMLIIPNTKLADTVLQNFFQPDKSVRVAVDFGVEYGTDPEYVKKISLEEISKISFIDRSQEVRALFTEMADSSLNFKVLFWVDDISKRWPAHQEGISRIYRRLYTEKIGIPFPQRTVWMREEGPAKPVSPHDEKFSPVHGKYFPKFGHEYLEEDEETSQEQEKKS